MKYHQSKGIVLKVNKWQEADLIVTTIMSDGSLGSYLAKNALRSKKRFGGGILEPSHFISFQWHQNKNGKGILDEANLIDDFPHIRKSYDQIGIAMKALHMVFQSTKEGLDNKEVFHLLGNFLKFFKPEVDFSLYFLHFEIRLLKILGVLPSEKSFDDFFQYTLEDTAKLKENSNHDLVAIRKYVESIKSDYF